MSTAATTSADVIKDLVDRSSLGSAGARSLREHTPRFEATIVREKAATAAAQHETEPDPPLLESLLRAAVAGEPQARDQLLAEIHPLVLRYCRARLGRQETLMGSADDVTQEVCLAVVNALPTYPRRGLSFRAFVYGLAAHKITDAFRAIGRNRSEPVADIPDAVLVHDGPEYHLLQAELTERLGALLHLLTPRQREVLVLRRAVGLSAEETAQAVGSTAGAVRVTEHRALNRLRRMVLAADAEGSSQGDDG
jgi:RNA polymerase sigma-70 factor, ECF subfamily